MTAWRIQYRDKRRPFVGLCLLSLTAESAQRAAGLARQQLQARGVHPVIVGVTKAA